MDNFCGVNALKGLRYLLQYVDPVYRHDMLRHKYQISFPLITSKQKSFNNTTLVYIC